MVANTRYFPKSLGTVLNLDDISPLVPAANVSAQHQDELTILKSESNVRVATAEPSEPVIRENVPAVPAGKASKASQ